MDPRDEGEASGWQKPGFDDSLWAAVIVPHTWNVMDAHWNYEGVAWYRKRFDFPKEAHGAFLRLQFQAVYYGAEVWLNGVPLGGHEGGYTPFEFNISHVVTPDEENVLAVRVENMRLPDRIPDDFFDWWHYGGITREVSIEATNRVYIERQHIVAHPRLTGWNVAEEAAITTRAQVVNTSSLDFDGKLSAKVIDEGSGKPIEETEQVMFEVPPGFSKEVELEILLPDPELWHFDHPHLYRWITSMENGAGEVFHIQEDVFGIRLVELREGQFLLNGEPVRLVGMTRHADSPRYGSAEPMTIMAADYEDMKRLNTVLSRPVHYPQADFILDYCDRSGILLSPEIPAWQIEAAHLANPEVREVAKQQLREMILEDFNHPSIWAWSVANEIDSNTPSGHQYVRELVDLAKELDPTRPVGFASYKLFDQQEQDATAFTDFVFMNEYAGSWHGTKSDLAEALERIHTLWPEKVVIISEFGLEAGWTSDWWMGPASQYETEEYYYIAPETPPHSQEVYAQRRALILEQMEIMRQRPYVVGAIFWTYQDYRSETDFHMGIVDMDRQRTPAWDVLREQYAPVWIDEVSPVAASEDRGGFIVKLRSRGPIEADMPAYTLRGYQLRWEISPVEGGEVLDQASLTIPDLSPGSEWAREITWRDPGEEYAVKLAVLRPTGFTVLERRYDSRGEILP